MSDSFNVLKKSEVPAKVSIIIPTYKRWELLPDALESVFGQTFQQWEAVVVNDGPGKPDGKAAKMLKDPRVTYVEHTENRGLAFARNTAIECSSGEYLAYLDDDDIFYPDHLQVLLGRMLENGWDVAYADAVKGVYEKEEGSYRLLEKKLEFSSDFTLEKLWHGNFIPVVCVVHRRDCLTKSGLFDPSLKVLEDWDLWLRMSRHNFFHHIPSVTAEYRVRQDRTNMSSATSNHLWDINKYAIYWKYFQIPGMIPDRNLQRYFRKSFSRFMRKNCREFAGIESKKPGNQIKIDMYRDMLIKDWGKMFLKNPFVSISILMKLF